VTTRYTRHPDLRVTALEGEGVVLHLGTRRYYRVSATGLDLLQALEQPRTLGELVAVLTAKYDVTEDEASHSTRAFLEHGVGSGVLLVEQVS